MSGAKFALSKLIDKVYRTSGTVVLVLHMAPYTGIVRVSGLCFGLNHCKDLEGILSSAIRRPHSLSHYPCGIETPFPSSVFLQSDPDLISWSGHGPLRRRKLAGESGVDPCFARHRGCIRKGRQYGLIPIGVAAESIMSRESGETSMRRANLG